MAYLVPDADLFPGKFLGSDLGLHGEEIRFELPCLGTTCVAHCNRDPDTGFDYVITCCDTRARKTNKDLNKPTDLTNYYKDKDLNIGEHVHLMKAGALYHGKQWFNGPSQSLQWQNEDVMIHPDRMIKLYDIVSSRAVLDVTEDRISVVIGSWYKKEFLDDSGNISCKLTPFVCGVPIERYEDRDFRIAAVGSGAKYAMKILKKLNPNVPMPIKDACRIVEMAVTYAGYEDDNTGGDCKVYYSESCDCRFPKTPNRITSIELLQKIYSKDELERFIAS